jgi:hypothetical protein
MNWYGWKKKKNCFWASWLVGDEEWWIHGKSGRGGKRILNLAGDLGATPDFYV